MIIKDSFCERFEKSDTNVFASAQCLGYNLEYGKMTKEICRPSEKTIMKQVLIK
jgi:hypothetical protein